MESQNKTDVIVVGAGPAGVACAITLARAGKKVLMIERGNFAGSKNVFGGAIYAKPMAEIFPEFWKTAPIERCTTEHRYALLTEEDATTICYKSQKHAKEGEYNSFTVIRAKWDKWCAQQAEDAGAYLAAQTVVRELIVKEGKVVGIKTDHEEYYADIVVLADGVNSLLAKQIGLRKEIEPKNVALGIKEVIRFKREVIESRFNLEGDSGCIYEIVGGPLSNMLGLGYLYTNKTSVVVGLGVALDELAKCEKKPYELLDELKAHPAISPLIKDGELIEYSAHLIPEGGYKSVPKLYGNGVMVVGDAAMLVNNVHWEGTNLAMVSGKLAAEAAIEALNKNDFSENMLSLYHKKLTNSFVIEDLKSYKDIMNIVHGRAKSYLGYWPKKISAFFETFTSVDSVPKKQKFRKYIISIFRDRGLIELLKDGINFIKIAIGVLK